MATATQDASCHAAQVVRRVLLRRNIAIDPRDRPARRSRRSGGAPGRRILPAAAPGPGSRNIGTAVSAENDLG
jgi:hypothetical protein